MKLSSFLFAYDNVSIVVWTLDFTAFSNLLSYQGGKKEKKRESKNYWY